MYKRACLLFVALSSCVAYHPDDPPNPEYISGSNNPPPAQSASPDQPEAQPTSPVIQTPTPSTVPTSQSPAPAPCDVLTLQHCSWTNQGQHDTSVHTYHFDLYVYRYDGSVYGYCTSKVTGLTDCRTDGCTDSGNIESHADTHVCELASQDTAGTAGWAAYYNEFDIESNTLTLPSIAFGDTSFSTVTETPTCEWLL